MAKDNGNNKWIGKRTPRPDGMDKVTGRAAFGADFSLPGMLFGRVLRSPHPHARIKSIKFEKALALPGVACRAVVPLEREVLTLTCPWPPTSIATQHYSGVER